MKLDQDVHNPYELGEGNYNIDEYSVILDKLPDGMTEEEFLNSFLKSPNDAAKSSVFDLLNVFQAKKAGSNEDWSPLELPELVDQGIELPEGVPTFEGPHMDLDAPSVGDWYHLEIPGNDGDVMIVDKDLDMEDDQISATVQTMTDDGPLFAENHPVSGRRQFGLEKLPDGGYRFYTRGFDRATNSVMEGEHSRMSQDQDWSALMRGMAAQHGGRAEHVDENGNPVWGWHEHYSAEELLKSGVVKPRPACE